MIIFSRTDPTSTERLEKIGEYLKDKVKGKHIVDINCGSAPILDYIPNTFKSFYGNDLGLESNETRVDENKITLECLDDKELTQKLQGKKIDIFLILGATVGHITPGHGESETQDVAIKQIVNIYKPEIIVLEMCQDYAYQSRFDLMHGYSTEWDGIYKRGEVIKMGKKDDSAKELRVFTTFERIKNG